MPAERGISKEDSFDGLSDYSLEISDSVIQKIILKQLLVLGRISIVNLAYSLALNVTHLERYLKKLYFSGFLHSYDTSPSGYQAFTFPRLSDKGRSVAQYHLVENAYRGPIPVAFDQYQKQVFAQSIRNAQLISSISKECTQDILCDQDLKVVEESILEGRCLMIKADSGIQYHTVINRFRILLNDVVSIPYAIEINGEIIKVFDASLHFPCDRKESANGANTNSSLSHLPPAFDLRWVRCYRPLIAPYRMYNKEMFEMLYEPYADTYDAALQIKANGGFLLLHSANLQKSDSLYLVDSLRTAAQSSQLSFSFDYAGSIGFPFDVLPVFIFTDEDDDVLDQDVRFGNTYSILMDRLTEEEFMHAFFQCCQQRDFRCEKGLMEYLLQKCREFSVPLRPDLPARLLDRSLSVLDQNGQRKYLSAELMDRVLQAKPC